jgi:hypothetical protein
LPLDLDPGRFAIPGIVFPAVGATMHITSSSASSPGTGTKATSFTTG